MWSRGDVIALIGLAIAFVAAFAAVTVIPNVRHRRILQVLASTVLVIAAVLLAVMLARRDTQPSSPSAASLTRTSDTAASSDGLSSASVTPPVQTSPVTTTTTSLEHSAPITSVKRQTSGSPNRLTAGVYNYGLPVARFELPQNDQDCLVIILKTVENDPKTRLRFNFILQNDRDHAFLFTHFLPLNKTTHVTDNFNRTYEVNEPPNAPLSDYYVAPHSQVVMSIPFDPVTDPRVTSITFEAEFKVVLPVMGPNWHQYVAVREIAMSLIR